MKIIYKILIIFCLLFALLFASFSIYAYICISKLDKTLFEKDNLISCFNQKLIFYDEAENSIASTFYNGKEVAKLEEMPNYLKLCFISIEDKAFYSHNGINIKRIIKSILDNLLSGYAKSGASTISQQLVKNLHLSGEKTLKRKIQEAYLTIKLEKNFSKDEILETYLNVIYFGHNTIGIESAANKFFSKHAKNLTLCEAATLAGIIKSPSLYSPINNPKSCLERRNLVLKEMLNDGYICDEEYVVAIQQGLETKFEQNVLDNSVYFKNAINEAEQILGLDEKTIAQSNYKIYTYLDQKMQNDAIKSLKETNLGLNSSQAFCSIIVNNKTMGVSAFVSSTEQTLKREIGSLIKPILCYAPAFEEGILSPLTPIDDSPLSYTNWSPKNANNTYDGYISAREALYNSKNIPAIKTLSYVGINKAKSYAQKLGICFTKEDNHLAIALGAIQNGTTPQAILASYACFANGGNFEDCHFIKRIEDYAGRIVYECKQEKTKVFSAETCYLINDILKDCAQIGTAKVLSDLDLTLSAKTGTVGNDNGNSDAWCICYNKNLSILSWAGNITGKKENNLNNAQNGGTITAKMCKALWGKNLSYNEWFTAPKGIISANIDAIDYDEKHILNLASPQTPQEFVISDIFNQKFVPTNLSTNFLEIEAPNFSIYSQDEKLYFKFDEKDYLTYDLYCNFFLVKKNVHTEFSLPLPNQSAFFFVVAKNKHTGQIKRSNIKVFLK